MIDLSQPQITFTEAAELARVSRQTIWRWARRGVRGVRLETVLVGGVRRTTEEALNAFCKQLTDLADGRPEGTPGNARRRREIERAERALEDL